MNSTMNKKNIHGMNYMKNNIEVEAYFKQGISLANGSNAQVLVLSQAAGRKAPHFHMCVLINSCTSCKVNFAQFIFELLKESY